ncbi:MAG: hypothetical protein QMB76_03030 [Alphaproteobacteria bacterium]
MVQRNDAILDILAIYDAQTFQNSPQQAAHMIVVTNNQNVQIG